MDFGAHPRKEKEEVKSVMRTARVEDRTPVGSLGQLELLGMPRDSECAWIENISDHGARVINRRRWRSGEHMLITSRFQPFRSNVASVVYCETLLAGLYAIGCESIDGGLLELLETRAEAEAEETQTFESSAACEGLPAPAQS
jgi:hypothetical protein